jgi:hypothetical protein
MSGLAGKAEMLCSVRALPALALLSQNMQRKATYLLGCSLTVDARQETDMPLAAFPA